MAALLGFKGGGGERERNELKNICIYIYTRTVNL